MKNVLTNICHIIITIFNFIVVMGAVAKVLPYAFDLL